VVVESGRVEEIRVIKIWRNQHGLDFPSFYLELAVIAGLKGRPVGALEGNVYRVLEFLAGEFVETEVRDPANSENVVSGELNRSEREAISAAAYFSLRHLVWEKVIGGEC